MDSLGGRRFHFGDYSVQWIPLPLVDSRTDRLGGAMDGARHSDRWIVLYSGLDMLSYCTSERKYWGKAGFGVIPSTLNISLEALVEYHMIINVNLYLRI